MGFIEGAGKKNICTVYGTDKKPLGCTKYPQEKIGDDYIRQFKFKECQYYDKDNPMVFKNPDQLEASVDEQNEYCIECGICCYLQDEEYINTLTEIPGIDRGERTGWEGWYEDDFQQTPPEEWIYKTGNKCNYLQTDRHQNIRFIRPITKKQMKEFQEYFYKYRHICITEFLDPIFLERLEAKYNGQFQVHDVKWEAKCHPGIDGSRIADRTDDQYNHTIETLMRNEFAWSFSWINQGSHSEECQCATCILEELFSNIEVVNLISEITHIKVDSLLESFSTWYKKGDFLSNHDDQRQGNLRKDRTIAFILNLSKNWNPSWGGNLTLTHRQSQHSIVAKYPPIYNALTLFDVRNGVHPHHVSMVNQDTPTKRLAYSGWFGSDEINPDDEYNFVPGYPVRVARRVPLELDE